MLLSFFSFLSGAEGLSLDHGYADDEGQRDNHQGPADLVLRNSSIGGSLYGTRVEFGDCKTPWPFLLLPRVCCYAEMQGKPRTNLQPMTWQV